MNAIYLYVLTAMQCVLNHKELEPYVQHVLTVVSNWLDKLSTLLFQ